MLLLFAGIYEELLAEDRLFFYFHPSQDLMLWWAKLSIYWTKTDDKKRFGQPGSTYMLTYSDNNTITIQINLVEV